MQTVTERPADRIQPWHDDHDADKVAALAASMSTDGWVGPPVVVMAGTDHGWGPGDPIAVTGSHRIAAARRVDLDVPTVDLDDLLAEHGTSLAQLDEECGTLPDDDRHYEAIIRLDQHLPVDVVEYYGLDAH